MSTKKKIFDMYDLRMPLNDKELQKNKLFIEKVFKYNYIPYLDRYKNRKDMKILEIGSNKGFMSSCIKQYFEDADVIGVDLSPNDIEFAKKNNSNIQFFCMDAFEILKKEKFDVIISKDVMEHIDKNKQEVFVDKIYNSLNEGGIAIIQVPNMDWILASHERYMDFTHEVGYTQESLKDIFRIYFDNNNIKVVPSSYIFKEALKQKICFGIIRPILVKFIKFIFKILGEGAADICFEHREIMAIVKK
ncbi:class I SAM-dependent methyltransferase [Anaerosinus sp.]|uniref:class I SAM-dependent methyltransferase n=1 Tax=Selenobaculum sp. TaxID=3074374 RepID=UPI003AB86D62